MAFRGLAGQGEVVDPQRCHRCEEDQEFEILFGELSNGGIRAENDETEGPVWSVEGRGQQRTNTRRNQALGLSEAVVGTGVGHQRRHGLVSDFGEEALRGERLQAGTRPGTVGDTGIAAVVAAHEDLGPFGLKLGEDVVENEFEQVLEAGGLRGRLVDLVEQGEAGGITPERGRIRSIGVRGWGPRSAKDFDR